MLRGSVDLEGALAGSHVGALKAEAWMSGRRIEADLPLVDGSVSVDSSQFVRRSADLSFVEETSSARTALGKILARPGVEVRVWRGARLGASSQFIPVHWGVAGVPKVSWPSHAVTMSSPDLFMRVARDRFPGPRQSRAGMTVAQQIEVLVRESIPWLLGFDDQSSDFTAVNDVTWDRDRNAAVDDLATAIGCEVFLRPDGFVVLRRLPTFLGIPTWRVSPGRNLVQADVETDWSGVRNHVVAYSDRADGTALWGESLDTDPTSPTYVYGALGRITGFYASSLFTTSAQCVTAAAAIRSRTQGAQVTVSYEMQAHPGVEARDRHDVTVNGTIHRIVLDSFRLQLTSATLTGSGRSATEVALS